VAERQTRTVQVRVLARVWGFKSPLAHSHSDIYPWTKTTYPLGAQSAENSVSSLSLDENRSRVNGSCRDH
jgi:hypothetical protein